MAKILELQSPGEDYSLGPTVCARVPQTEKRSLGIRPYCSTMPGLDVELPKEGSTRKQWRISRLLRDPFRRRWGLEYLPTLDRREKWYRITEPVHQGYMVFVCLAPTRVIQGHRGVGLQRVHQRFVRRAKVRVIDNGL
ncbi:GD17703 [Drosophila simulans]|uniref:GD17703 n=1 Tax=Drosophila simulans TaxID=7240 RepID=B4NST4_DROSI|nr:GD17703 [Drosophila simulans]